VVVDAYVAEQNRQAQLVTDRYGLRNVHLYEPEVEWVYYEPRRHARARQGLSDGIKIPAPLFDKNIVHLPTVKTHVFTTITGAMKNALAACCPSGALDASPSSTRRWSTC